MIQKILEVKMIAIALTVPLSIVADMVLGITLSKKNDKFDIQILKDSIRNYLGMLIGLGLISLATIIGGDAIASVLNIELPINHLLSLGFATYALTVIKEALSKFLELTGYNKDQEIVLMLDNDIIIDSKEGDK